MKNYVLQVPYISADKELHGIFFLKLQQHTNLYIF